MSQITQSLADLGAAFCAGISFPDFDVDPDLGSGPFYLFSAFLPKLLVYLFSIDILTSARHCWARIIVWLDKQT